MHEIEGEVISEETAPADGNGARPLPQRYEPAVPARREVRNAALAAAGGVLAGAATVAAVRAVSGSGSPRKRPQRILGRSERANVVASRSFLIDVHLLGK